MVEIKRERRGKIRRTAAKRKGINRQESPLHLSRRFSDNSQKRLWYRVSDWGRTTVRTVQEREKFRVKKGGPT